MKYFIHDKKGASGIGTLIVFIAMVLVAAVAASVLINTSGFLQQKASTVGKESTDQVASGIQVLSVTGHIYTLSATKYGLDKIAVYISPNSGSGPIDITHCIVQLTYGDRLANINYTHKENATIGNANVFSLDDTLSFNHSISSYTGTTIYTDDEVAGDIIRISTTDPDLRALLKGFSSGDAITIVTNHTNAPGGNGAVSSITRSDSNLTVNISMTAGAAVTADGQLSGLEWFKINGTADLAKSDATSFTIIALQDEDDSISDSGVLNGGDIGAIVLNTEAIFGTEILNRKEISGKIMPEFGAPGIISFTTPASYTDTIIELQ